MRLQEPKFHAIYNPDTEDLEGIIFEGRKDYPDQIAIEPSLIVRESTTKATLHSE